MSGKNTTKISLRLPNELLEQIKLSASAYFITKSDYIRRVLAKAVKEDQAFVQQENKSDLSAPTPAEIDDKSEQVELLRRFGLL